MQIKMTIRKSVINLINVHIVTTTANEQKKLNIFGSQNKYGMSTS